MSSESSSIRRKAHMAVLGANLLFGINYSMVKWVTPGLMTPFALNLARIGVSVPLFWLLYLIKPSSAGIDKADVPRFIRCALTGVAINQLFFIKGLSLTSTIHGSLLALGTPIFITAAAAWLLHDKLTTNKIAGLALGVGGACLLVLSRHGSGEQGRDVVLGDIMIIINSISYALYFVWVQPLMRKYNPVHVLRWVFTIGACFIFPFGIIDLLHTDFSTFNAFGWMSLAFVILGATFFSYLFNMYGLKYLGPGITGTYIYTQPLFAAIIGVLFLHEKAGLPQVLAAALIVSGVWLVNKKQPAKNS